MESNTCPDIDLFSAKYSTTTIAKCTEVTYACVNESHVLVVGGGGVCLNVDKTTRDCSNDVWDPKEEPYCSRTYIQHESDYIYIYYMHAYSL